MQFKVTRHFPKYPRNRLYFGISQWKIDFLVLTITFAEGMLKYYLDSLYKDQSLRTHNSFLISNTVIYTGNICLLWWEVHQDFSRILNWEIHPTELAEMSILSTTQYRKSLNKTLLRSPDNFHGNLSTRTQHKLITSLFIYRLIFLGSWKNGLDFVYLRR